MILTSTNLTISETRSGNISKYAATIPQLFLRNETNKIGWHEFHLFAYYEIRLAVLIRINVSTLTQMRAMFSQTTSIKIITPYRAVLNEGKIFSIVLKNNQVINLPRNLPIMD